VSFQFGAFQADAFQLGSGAGQNLAPPLYTNDNTFYAASLTRGPVDLAPARFDNTNTFYGGQLDLTLTAARFDNSNTFYGAQVNLDLIQAARFDNSNTFYSPSLGFEVLPDLYTNANTFYSPTVANAGADQALVCDDYVLVGYVTDGYVIFPASFTVNEFYAATLVYDQTVYPGLFTNTNTFYTGRTFNQYPNPWQVQAGVVYGPNGEFTGTLAAGRPVYVFDD
jgi:hypothetical protein